MSKLKQVRPEGFDVEALMAAAREGRLFVDEGKKIVSKAQVVKDVCAYVARIRTFVTNDYETVIDELWEQILSTEQLVEYLMPKPKARLCKEFDKYNVVRIIGVLREKGVYQYYSDRKYDALLEPDGKESPYRRYMGMGIEEHSLLVKIRKIVEQYQL
ncbi:hypothetical protein [Xylanibacter ruminicola]|uniref:Uncharacterized protein n=1 Tax=Xylanibacter ruminicola TaxID=839 RepID=A0A1M6Z9Y9_XYLRU|nr:hypothetical protein [Xylanibacter ruminicola]SHL27179.1 hypothetical protein SAMN05216463_1455 [Xylanibacter ruminicola]